MTYAERALPTSTKAQTVSAPSAPIAFGSFVVLPSARTLLHEGTPVDIGGRAFDMLMALLNARGQILSKEALIRQVWPDTFVEETNLRVQLSRLRRALGDDGWRIKTVQCRGYLMITEAAVAAPETPRLTANEREIFIIEANGESGEQLRQLLASAGMRILGSLAGLLRDQVAQPSSVPPAAGAVSR